MVQEAYFWIKYESAHCVLSMFLAFAKVMSSCEPSFQHKQDPKNWFFLRKLRPKLTISDQLDVWRSRIWRHPPSRFLNADHLRNVLLHLGKSGRQHDANGTFIHPASGNRMNKNKNKKVCDYFPLAHITFGSSLSCSLLLHHPFLWCQCAPRVQAL